MGLRVDKLEEPLAVRSTFAASAEARALAQEERESTVDTCLDALDQFASTHSQASVLADIRVQDFEQRVAELELRIGDLELIRIHMIRDEHNDRVSALESAAEAYEEWH